MEIENEVRLDDSKACLTFSGRFTSIYLTYFTIFASAIIKAEFVELGRRTPVTEATLLARAPTAWVTGATTIVCVGAGEQ